MTDIDVTGILQGLKGFQRDAVYHLIDQFYPASGGPGSRRFLIADETGLGKSIVARGAIARTIEILNEDPRVGRIDVVYICSNQDLARQNLRRLNVTGERELPLATRLTLLATVLPRLSQQARDGAKKVNLISFTPATSGMAGGGWRTGLWEERALLAILLRPLATRDDADWDCLVDLLKATKGIERFRAGVDELTERLGVVDRSIVVAFEELIGARTAERDGASMVGRMTALVAERRSGQHVHWERIASLVGQLRQALAKASLTALEPDLVILDEFQKFRQLLAAPETSEAAELAHAMFEYEGARVLLLSATPYSPFTRADDAEDNHYKDFLETVRFLAGWDAEPVNGIRDALERYRGALVSGGDAEAAADAVRAALLPYMTRSERPQVTDGFAVRELQVEVPSPDDVVEFATLRSFGEQVGAPIDIEYWKSIPYFANFMDGYKPGERARAAFGTDEGRPAEQLLAATRSLQVSDLESFRAVDAANGYLRALQADTVNRGWWRMLWMPPSMAYLEPGPVYEGLGALTKRLVFSAWSGVPTSVASLLSYAADRAVAAASSGFLVENTAAARLKVADRFTYRTRAGEVSSLSTLALFWPHPTLARLGDPLVLARTAGRSMAADDAERMVGAQLPVAAEDSRPWDAFYSIGGHLPPDSDARALVLEAVGDETSEEADAEVPDSGVLRHVDEAVSRAAGSTHEFGHPDLPRLALHSPGNIALRAIRRIAGPSATDRGIWTAAFTIADGLRRLFDRIDSVATLVGIYGDGQDQPYWSSVLSYCADGNLQAVLDEYLFQLRSELRGVHPDDTELMKLARHVSDVLRLRPARYVGHDTSADRRPIPFQARFALRYGARFGDNADVRDGQVRAAFNSPFAPFVLVSTSVGQEGIDFHWWCHAVVHWNLPRNPVDFEQREGRVNRFAGHAIRRNVAVAHWPDVLSSDSPDPWATAFEHATRAEHASKFGEFAPWWVYPGPAQVQRIIARYPLSRDHDRYERLRDDLALYRLTLGQPRQEDMVDLLRKRGVDGQQAPTIDLRPPARGPVSS
ncbi:helicase domain protein [Xylanimonas cellulosilytica DSM 15894]|uniref:Helicase domain protein n=1 Tax=Xylanimonas cellulosilytica (strain DSM 15894 / JCM 12276 / CECT 5975 / KCTC 9989 / LMG 20990 / NBRC 107835 / XIL07) TaxID=446471 RepID=D1BVN3_XYLCX|nr:helicase-related protein [Xylanimonas cellulosilytica]ACZ31352.1 helicase domain protein [Xylanimonas cellulosilytica DSM 15894]